MCIVYTHKQSAKWQFLPYMTQHWDVKENEQLGENSMRDLCGIWWLHLCVISQFTDHYITSLNKYLFIKV